MQNPCVDHPVLNSPHECPDRHCELDKKGQPTQQILNLRRRAEFITPIPKPKKRKNAAAQRELELDEGNGLSTTARQYDPTPIVHEVRGQVDTWRNLQPGQWQGQSAGGPTRLMTAGMAVKPGRTVTRQKAYT